MKTKKVTFGILAIAMIGLTLTACKENKKDEKKENQMEMKHSEEKKAYACPMKCEGDKTYDKPGSCPVCNMDLKEMKHSDDHAGHNH